MIAEFWKTTAEMYSYLFDKPKMSQKLLEKPPFKYIFDIVMETMKQTGFYFTLKKGYAQGLYSNEELNGDFYDSKDKKIFFLEKIISLTSMVLNEEIVAKPGKIVTGYEPENTNLLLQAIYRAAISGTHCEYQISAAIGAGPQNQILEQVQASAMKQVQLDSTQSKLIELNKIIFEQQQIIQGLKKELELKDSKILSLEQELFHQDI